MFCLAAVLILAGALLFWPIVGAWLVTARILPAELQTCLCSSTSCVPTVFLRNPKYYGMWAIAHTAFISEDNDVSNVVAGTVGGLEGYPLRAEGS